MVAFIKLLWFSIEIFHFHCSSGCAHSVTRELFLDRERQIDGIFIEFGPRFCPRI